MDSPARSITLYQRNRWLWIGLGVVMGIVGGWLQFKDSSGAPLVVGGVLTMVSALRTRIELAADGIAYHYYWWRTAARWDELSHIEPVRAGGRAMPYLVLKTPTRRRFELGVPRHLQGRSIPLRGPWERDGELELELAIRRHAPLIYQAAPPARPPRVPSRDLFVHPASPANQLRTLWLAFLLLGALSIALVVAAELMK